MTVMRPTPLQRPALLVARVMARSMAPADLGDMVDTLDAEDVSTSLISWTGAPCPPWSSTAARMSSTPASCFEQAAAGVQDGGVHIYPDWGHGRTAGSAATANLALGFLLAA